MKIELIIKKLDNDIDRLVEKYGMNSRIEAVNEEWTDLMHAYYTDYRGPNDDPEVIRLLTEIYQEIVSIKQFNERPLFERMNDLSMNKRIATTSVNAVRYKNSIVIEGNYHDLKQIKDKYDNVHKIQGKFVDFTKNGGPRGLMFGQRHGKNLFHLKIIDRDLSNKGLGIEPPVKKRKRDDNDQQLQPAKKQSFGLSSDFYIGDSYMYLLNMDVTDKLDDLLVPYATEDKVVMVQLQYFDILARKGLLGNAVSKPSKQDRDVIDLTKPKPPPVPKPFVSRRFKAYMSHGKSVVVGKRKHIDKLRTKLDIKRRIQSGNQDDIDLVVINNKDRKKATKVLNFELKSNDPELPQKYLPLLYRLYPSRKPAEEKKTRPIPPPKPEEKKKNEDQAILDSFNDLDDVFNDTPHQLVKFNDHNTLDDWYEFRGSAMFQYPWVVKMQLERSNLYRHWFYSSQNRQGAIYHIAVKRDSKWTKHLKSTMSALTDKVLLPDGVNDAINKCTINGWNFLFTFLIHEFSAKSRHANALVIDFKNRRVIRFEPHGSLSGCYDQIKCDNQLKNAIGNFTYMGPSDFEKQEGPQTKESRHQTMYNKITKKFGNKERVIEAGGFCMAWSILFNHMVHLNDIATMQKIYNDYFDVDANELATNIRVFQSYLVKLSKEYWGSNYISPLNPKKKR